MISCTRITLTFALFTSLAAGCVLADEGTEEDATLEEAEASSGLTIRRLAAPPPGTQSVKLHLTSTDPDHEVFEGKKTICKTVGGGGTECNVWICDNHKIDEENNCVWQCGYSCDAGLDECSGVGC